MEEKIMENEIHYEKDKHLIPYLLACHPRVAFVGTKNENGIVYFGFTPSTLALELISQYFTNQTPPIFPKQLFEAIEQFRTILFREKDKYRVQYGGGKYGGKNY